MKKFVAAAILAATSVSELAEADVSVGRASMTGNGYLQMSPIERAEYANGVVDGFLYAAFLAGVDLPFTDHIENGFKAMRPTRGQYSSIVDHCLEESPAFFGEDMHWLVFHAVAGACAQVGRPLL